MFYIFTSTLQMYLPQSWLIMEWAYTFILLSWKANLKLGGFFPLTLLWIRQIVVSTKIFGIVWHFSLSHTNDIAPSLPKVALPEPTRVVFLPPSSCEWNVVRVKYHFQYCLPYLIQPNHRPFHYPFLLLYYYISHLNFLYDIINFYLSFIHIHINLPSLSHIYNVALFICLEIW